MAGTVAGADTIIVITRSEEDAEHFIERIENMIFKIESINRREFFLGRIESATKWFGYSGNCFGYGRANCNINRNSSSRDCGGRGSLVTG